jgi:hypothetical protein
VNAPVDTALLDDLTRSAGTDRIIKHVVGAVITNEDGNQSKSGKLTRQFNFSATTTGETVKLTEHDDHLWAGRDQQEKVSNAVRAVLATWRGRAA